MKYLQLLLLFVFLGCSKDYTILESVDNLILSADQSTKIINQTTTFKLQKNNGENITDNTVFYVNGTMINGNTFTTDQVGTYFVEAKYLGFDAVNSLEIIYHDGSLVSFKSNVMVEDYTGVWCGNCPRVSYALELASQQLDANSDQLIKVGIHRSSSNPQDSSYDPYNFDSSAFEPNGGYPKAFVNRKTRWTPLEHNNLDMIVNQTQLTKRLGLKLSTETLSNNSVKLNVSCLFTENYSDVKLVVYVLEDGLIYDQVNYTTFYNGDGIIVDFVHDHVLKKIITQHNGDVIENSATGSELNREFTINLDNISDVNKTEYVAFIVDTNGNVLNSRKCHINEFQEYQFQ